MTSFVQSPTVAFNARQISAGRRFATAVTHYLPEGERLREKVVGFLPVAGGVIKSAKIVQRDGFPTTAARLTEERERLIVMLERLLFLATLIEGFADAEQSLSLPEPITDGAPDRNGLIV